MGLQLTFEARDAPSNVTETRLGVEVQVLDINDNPPVFQHHTYTTELKESASQDQNDNLPEQEMATMDMCLSDEPSKVNITAFDLDGKPYSGPFNFQLQGNDVIGKWRIDPDNGYTVNLVKENTVYGGHYELLLKVFDEQGQGALHNLSITVCDCSGVASCRFGRVTGTKIEASAIGIVIAVMLLLLEGDLETDLQLDAISIPDQDRLLYLGARFNTLASICNTPDYGIYQWFLHGQ